MQTAQKMNETNYGMIYTNELLLWVDEYSGIPFYASMNAYLIAGLYRPLQKRRLFLEALKALRTRDASDGCCQKLRILPTGPDYETLWVVQDETSITFKFPEDD